MKENPEKLRRAVAIAMAEQNFRKWFNLRTGRQLEDHKYHDIESMDVSTARPQYCHVCRRLGHTAANYKFQTIPVLPLNMIGCNSGYVTICRHGAHVPRIWT